MSEISSVLHVIATLDRGGTEVSCLGLTRALSARGVDNHLIAISEGARSIVPEFDELVPEIRTLPLGRSARMRAFGDILRQVRPDAVIFHFFTLEHVLLGAVAKRAGVSRVVTKQGNPAATDPRVRAKSQLILVATRVLGIALVSSSSWIERTMTGLGRLPDGSRVIHNGCDTDAIATRAAKARAQADPEEAVILMVARLDQIKDHATLIRAVACIPETICGRRVMLDLVGEGPLRAELEHLARAKGVVDRVRFMGVQSDIPEQLGKAGVFCLSTTRDEGFGVVLIEALAASCPVVASDVPACAEVLEGGVLGKLVPPKEPKVLALALEDALRPETAAPPALQEVAARYDAANMAQRYLDVLGKQAICSPRPADS